MNKRPGLTTTQYALLKSLDGGKQPSLDSLHRPTVRALEKLNVVRIVRDFGMSFVAATSLGKSILAEVKETSDADAE